MKKHLCLQDVTSLLIKLVDLNKYYQNVVYRGFELLKTTIDQDGCKSAMLDKPEHWKARLA